MLKSYIPAHRVVETWKTLDYFRDAGGGCSFKLDDNGTPILATEAARKNYEYCLAHPEEYPYACGEVKVCRHSYLMPATGICQCGAEIPLHGEYYGASQCNCGLWYNTMGQEILPPEMWEERLEDWE